MFTCFIARLTPRCASLSAGDGCPKIEFKTGKILSLLLSLIASKNHLSYPPSHDNDGDDDGSGGDNDGGGVQLVVVVLHL